MQFPKLDEKKRIEKLNVPNRKINLIIDTDTKNEVDDQFAIAWALSDKEHFDVKAVYAAPFCHDCFNQFNEDKNLVEKSNELNGSALDPADGMEQSYEEIKNIFDKMGEPTEGRVFRGSESYLTEKTSYIYSEAAKDLVKRAMECQELLYVASIGTPTNIASAILMEPRIVEKIVVVWLGGHELNFGHGIEFNLIQDVKATQILFDSGVPLIWIPCNNVAALLQVSSEELKKNMLKSGEIGKYLVEGVLDTFQNPQSSIAMMKLLRNSSLLDNTDQDEEYLDQFKTYHIAWSRTIWDIATIAMLKNPNWLPSKLMPAPKLNEDYTWDTSDQSRHLIRVATYCHRDMIFGDLFACLVREKHENK